MLNFDLFAFFITFIFIFFFVAELQNMKYNSM